MDVLHPISVEEAAKQLGWTILKTQRKIQAGRIPNCTAEYNGEKKKRATYDITQEAIDAYKKKIIGG